jgi:hypothetical protein
MQHREAWLLADCWQSGILKTARRSSRRSSIADP